MWGVRRRDAARHNESGWLIRPERDALLLSLGICLSVAYFFAFICNSLRPSLLSPEDSRSLETDEKNQSIGEKRGIAGGMNPPVRERRKHERLALRLPVWFSSPDGSPNISCFTENVSGGGFYCLSPTPFSAEEHKEVHLLLPTRGYSRSAENVDIRCNVRVVRVDALGAGRGFGVACQIERYTFLWAGAK